MAPRAAAVRPDRRLSAGELARPVAARLPGRRRPDGVRRPGARHAVLRHGAGTARPGLHQHHHDPAHALGRADVHRRARHGRPEGPLLPRGRRAGASSSGAGAASPSAAGGPTWAAPSSRPVDGRLRDRRRQALLHDGRRRRALHGALRDAGPGEPAESPARPGPARPPRAPDHRGVGHARHARHRQSQRHPGGVRRPGRRAPRETRRIAQERGRDSPSGSATRRSTSARASGPSTSPSTSARRSASSPTPNPAPTTRSSSGTWPR